MTEHTPLDRITNRETLMKHLREQHAITMVNGEFLAQLISPELIRAHTTLHAKMAVEAAKERADERWRVWATDGRAFFVVNNREFEVVVPPTLRRAAGADQAARMTAETLAEALGTEVKD